MNESDQKACLHAIVDGRVQGVGFRSFVLIMANELELFGWVRNLDDGMVEVLAEGNLSQLWIFLEYLQRGPRSAFVTDVKYKWLPHKGQFRDFVVKFGYND